MMFPLQLFRLNQLPKIDRIAAIGLPTPPVSHGTLLPMVFWWAWFALQLVPVAWYIVARDSQPE
jgi:hypothetical protein